MNKITQSINKSQEEFTNIFTKSCRCLTVKPCYEYLKEKECTTATNFKSFLPPSNTELLGAVVESLPNKKELRRMYSQESKGFLREDFSAGYNQALTEIKQIIQEAI